MLTQIRNSKLTESFVSNDPEWWTGTPEIGSKNKEGMECVSVCARKSGTSGFVLVEIEWRD